MCNLEDRAVFESIFADCNVMRVACWLAGAISGRADFRAEIHAVPSNEACTHGIRQDGAH